MSGDEFYVGYLPAAPPRLARWLAPRVGAALLAAAALAAALALAQTPFSRAHFEFGRESRLEGILRERPVPLLQIARPGGTWSSYLLTSAGKHGAADAVRGLDGRRVRIAGSLIYRDERTMIELAPGGVEVLGDGGPESPPVAEGPATLRGEIVDSKCFLGVMKPGNLKPHRDCAVRCISGGVPPMLLVRDREGNASYFLLVGPGGRSINAELLPFVAEPVEIRGELARYSDLVVLEADPADFRRLP